MAGVPEVQRFFREAGDVDVDKSDIDRFRAFVDEKIDDFAISARDSARWNNRDVIAPQYLPITKGCRNGCASSASSRRPATCATGSARRCAAPRTT